jgi:release factor glutamine methyltransferase
MLVAAALDLLPPAGSSAPRVLDLGTGSGAIALALGRERPDAVIVATDLSEEALKIAQQNAEELGMSGRIRFAAGDGFDAAGDLRFELVACNPPYLDPARRKELPPELAHEPQQALFAGEAGLAMLRRIAGRAAAWLEPAGALILEHAPDQADEVAAACRAGGLVDVALHRDLCGRPRVTTARRSRDAAPIAGAL